MTSLPPHRPRRFRPPPGRLLARLGGGRSPFGPRAPALAAFLEDEIRTEAGRFRFRGREPLREVADHLGEILDRRLPGRTVSVLKGAQVGMTTAAIGLALWCVCVGRWNVGYFLPDQDFADRFDDTRIRPAIRRGRLRGAMRDGAYRGASPKGLKEFPGADGSRFLYVLGLRDIGNAISLPLDVLIRDEVDDLPEENLRWSDDRLDASPLALTVNLAVGRRPGEGIHAMYLRGDRRRWRIRCGGCGAEAAPEEAWPGVLAEAPEGPFLACPSCGARLRRAAGRWEAEEPGAPERSYRLSQLAVEAIGLGRIAAKWRAARLPSERARFRCASLALPDAGDLQPVGAELLARLRGGDPHAMEALPA